MYCGKPGEWKGRLWWGVLRESLQRHKYAKRGANFAERNSPPHKAGKLWPTALEASFLLLTMPVKILCQIAYKLFFPSLQMIKSI